MIKLKQQLNQLNMELEKRHLSKERVLEIKELTKEIAKQIDEDRGNACAFGMVMEVYRVESIYVKRKVKRVVHMLLKSLEE